MVPEGNGLLVGLPLNSRRTFIELLPTPDIKIYSNRSHNLLPNPSVSTIKAGPSLMFAVEMTGSVVEVAKMLCESIVPGLWTQCPGNSMVDTPRGSPSSLAPFGVPLAARHVLRIVVPEYSFAKRFANSQFRGSNLSTFVWRSTAYPSGII